MSYSDQKSKIRSERVCQLWRRHSLTVVPWPSLDFTVDKKISSSEVEAAVKRRGGSVESIVLRQCSGVQDSTVRAIARHCARIESLDLAACEKISDEALESISTCRRLTRCNLDSCTGLSTEGVLKNLGKIKGLESLSMRGCDKVDAKLIVPHLLESCTGLSELRIAGMKGMREAMEHVAAVTRPDAERKRRSVTLDTVGMKTLPRRIDIHCGICNEKLFAGVSSYTCAERSQRQIEFELYTNETPLPGRLKPSAVRLGFGGGPPGSSSSSSPEQQQQQHRDTMFNCPRNCHGLRWLVDAGSGLIPVYNFRYAIALGNKLAICADSKDGSPVGISEGNNEIRCIYCGKPAQEHEEFEDTPMGYLCDDCSLIAW
eukprot:CAMPEP_0170177032 /NCGR_PEP_ID=MMETSP0040_2-20121228/9769_1 /TAXON_ID=641309 /ORGANISM="Lotharella oceanica, Strain CCMP622" /LENGTH=372 /DNA_ID=CAMNT_0010419529 /DNA_START=39 /DNA_END=1160 /DNA_ORIENTATION=+